MGVNSTKYMIIYSQSNTQFPKPSIMRYFIGFKLCKILLTAYF
mgnify:CR=1 FL=1